ncbi:MAG: hypothetical protein NVS2B16_29750 [Chloroflexota bacterium]
MSPYVTVSSHSPDFPTGNPLQVTGDKAAIGITTCNTDAFVINIQAGGPSVARPTAMSLERQGAILTLTWRLVNRSMVIGFNLTAGNLRLNPYLIPVHRSQT